MRRALNFPDLETLEFLLSYNPETGIFIWRWGRYIGKQAGQRKLSGFMKIKIKNGEFNAHELAWLMYHKTEPYMIYHVNGNRQDNRITNLASSRR
jgi:hypothetical protein